MGPEFAALADALRRTFGADVKLTWLDTPALKHGTEPDRGITTQWRGERKRA